MGLFDQNMYSFLFDEISALETRRRATLYCFSLCSSRSHHQYQLHVLRVPQPAKYRHVCMVMHFVPFVLLYE
jgi:hypothetical protein